MKQEELNLIGLIVRRIRHVWDVWKVFLPVIPLIWLWAEHEMVELQLVFDQVKVCHYYVKSKLLIDKNVYALGHVMLAIHSSIHTAAAIHIRHQLKMICSFDPLKLLLWCSARDGRSGSSIE